MLSFLCLSNPPSHDDSNSKKGKAGLFPDIDFFLNKGLSRDLSLSLPVDGSRNTVCLYPWTVDAPV